PGLALEARQQVGPDLRLDPVAQLTELLRTGEVEGEARGRDVVVEVGDDVEDRGPPPDVTGRGAVAWWELGGHPPILPGQRGQDQARAPRVGMSAAREALPLAVVAAPRRSGPSSSMDRATA